MILDIYNYKISTNNCTKYNNVWESKGIILSIVYFIIIHYKKLKNMTIVIVNKRFRKIIKCLFNHLTFDKSNNNKSYIYMK